MITFHDNTDLINCSCPPESQLTVSDTSMGIPEFSSWCVTLLTFMVHQEKHQSNTKHWHGGHAPVVRLFQMTGITTRLHSTGIRPTLPCRSKKMRIRRAVVMETDLHSAFDQIKGNNCCVCGATTQNPTKSTQDEILLRAEFTTVSL